MITALTLVAVIPVRVAVLASITPKAVVLPTLFAKERMPEEFKVRLLVWPTALLRFWAKEISPGAIRLKLRFKVTALLNAAPPDPIWMVVGARFPTKTVPPLVPICAKVPESLILPCRLRFP